MAEGIDEYNIIDVLKNQETDFKKSNHITLVIQYLEY